MKIEVSKSNLVTALSVVKVAVNSTGNDLSTHYLFRIRQDRVEILSFGVKLFACAPVNAQHEGAEGDAFTVEAWRLEKWVAGVGEGVLTLSCTSQGSVDAKGPRASVRLRSLDPSKWPFQDDLMDSAKVSGQIDPRCLARAFGLARWFVSADDTNKPELCQIEVKNGVLWSTDRRALSSVQIPALPDLNLRVPGDVVSSIMKFLTDKTTVSQDITIKTAEQTFEQGGRGNFSFWRADGSYVGAARPSAAVPDLQINREEVPPVHMELDMSEFTAGLAVLSASAPKGHGSVTFSNKDGALFMSMPSEAGGSDEYPLELAKIEESDEGKFSRDFTVGHHYVKGIGNVFGLARLKFGLCDRGRGGYISFHHRDEGEDDKVNDYMSVIVWKS